MKKLRTAITFVLFILAIVVIYIIFYNRVYHISADIDDVSMIKIQTNDSNGFNTTTITDPEQVRAYVETAKKIIFSHPKIYTGKGFTTMVDLKMKDKNGTEKTYRYTITDTNIVIGHFKFDILTE